MQFKKIIKTIFGFSIFLLFGVASLGRVNAAIAEKIHNRTFTLQDDYILVNESKKVTVTQYGYQVPQGSLEGFTIFNPVEGDPEAEEKLQRTIESIEVKDDSGNILEYELEQNESNNFVVKVPHPRNIATNQTSEIFLTYKSYGLVIQTGAVRDIYIPGYPSDYVFEDNRVLEKIYTRLVISKTYPRINFSSPKQNVTEDGENRIIEISQDNLVGNSVWIQLGTKQYFTFEINQIIPKTNTVPFAINTFSLPIPRDVQSGPITQAVYYEEISPKPYSIYEDKDGNLIAQFKASASQEEHIYIKGYAELEQDPDFDLTNAGKVSDISEDYDRYLLAGNYWEVTDSTIEQTASQISDSEDIYQIIQDTYDFVTDRIDYSFVKKYGLNERKGALATLNGGAAVCMEYSDLFITLLRAQGIPARAAFGYGYGAADYESRSENRINHQWAEVYMPALDTWINVDTTWGDFGSNLIGGDLNHFYSHVASIDPETPSTSELSYFGTLESIPERDMKINIVQNIPENSNGKSQKKLIQENKKPSGIDSITYLIGQQSRILNNGINSFTQDHLGLNISNISFLAKLLLCCCIPSLLVMVVFIKKFNHGKKRKVEILN
ncbi:transglutaminase domain-containing protein [Candidatus Dojkabacteria bacterium]|uniref:Transglutaminase domain-containing protein n=1 Tax=Candidatus Dojkabacteria bacterium TaxID=2099670 RepID=A0A955RL80_9BACT|nr:transglutaminase domain-containing protein [Candidatus Dojkabacteria bacterium]